MGKNMIMDDEHSNGSVQSRPSVDVEDLSTDLGDTPLIEKPKSEMLSQALFSNKVRNMVQAYKEEILDLETKVREAVEENFRYLDMPEPGRVTRIVEKHIANMQAEILGIQDDLTHFELSKLNYGNSQYQYRVLTKPTGIVSWYANALRRHRIKNNWCADWNDFINANRSDQSRRENRAAVTHNVHMPVFEVSLIDTSSNNILYRIPQVTQMNSYWAFHTNGNNGNLRMANWDTWIKETGTGSIGKYGTFYKGRSDTSECYGEGDHHGWGLPSAGFYRLDNRRHFSGGAGGNEFHQGAYDWHGSPNESGGDGYLIARRCNADGVSTQEPNSDIDFLRGFPLRGAHPVRIGDFFVSHGACSSIVDGSSASDWNRRYESTAAAAALQLIELVNFPTSRNDGNINNTLIYYWTWRDEVPTLQDAENVESFLIWLSLCHIRWYSIRTHNWDREDGTNDVHPNHRNDLDFARNGTRLWMPKGCRHKEQMFHMRDHASYNGSILAFIQFGGPGGKAYYWEPRYCGISNDEASTDKAWREKALSRGEPLWDMKTSAFVDDTNNLSYYVKLTRFVVDQERFHNAQALAQREGASETDKKNYDIIKRWFYTKYDHLRSNKSQDQVEALGEKMMNLLELAEGL